MILFTLIDPKRRSTVPSSRNKQSVLSVIVDLSEFRDEKRPVLGEVSAEPRDARTSCRWKRQAATGTCLIHKFSIWRITGG